MAFCSVSEPILTSELINAMERPALSIVIFITAITSGVILFSLSLHSVLSVSQFSLQKIAGVRYHYITVVGVPNPFYPPKKVAEITKIPKTAQKYSLLFIFTNLLIFVFMHFIYILYYFNCIYAKRYSYTGVTFKFLMLNLPFLIWNFQNQNKNYMQKRDTTSNFLLRN